jgi:hypothetical protein
MAVCPSTKLLGVMDKSATDSGQVLRLAAAVVIGMGSFITLDLLLTYLDLHQYIKIQEQLVSPTTIVCVFLGSLLGAFMGCPFYTPAMVFVYLLMCAYVVHVLQRVADNVANAPTYFEVFLNTTYSLGLGLVSIILAGFIGYRIRQIGDA